MLRAVRQWLALPARTRRLIADHPQLLHAFERWLRNHRTQAGFKETP